MRLLDDLRDLTEIAGATMHLAVAR